MRTFPREGFRVDITRQIGEGLRRARIERGLTLRAAASASGSRFKPSSIAGYERGERAVTLQRFCDLAELYGADAGWLLDGILRDARAALAADPTSAEPGPAPDAPDGAVIDLREDEPELSTSRPAS
jgi:transcriptional regulator with XRE-family HTH domain